MQKNKSQIIKRFMKKYGNLLLPTFIPFILQNNESQKTKKIRKKYGFLLLLTTLLPIILLVLTTWGVGEMLFYSQHLIYSDQNYIRTSLPTFLIPSLFLGFAFSFYTGRLLYKFVKKLSWVNINEFNYLNTEVVKRHIEIETYEEFTNNNVSKFLKDWEKIEKPFCFCLIIISLILIFLGINSYSKITNEGIVQNAYFSIEEKLLPYNEIIKILYVKQFQEGISGEIKFTSPEYIVVMRNGYNWATLNTEFNGTEREKKIMEYISQKSNIPITPGIYNVDNI